MQFLSCILPEKNEDFGGEILKILLDLQLFEEVIKYKVELNYRNISKKQKIEQEKRERIHKNERETEKIICLLSSI